MDTFSSSRLQKLGLPPIISAVVTWTSASAALLERKVFDDKLKLWEANKAMIFKLCRELKYPK